MVDTTTTLLFTLLITLTTTLYLIWFHFISRTLTGPPVYPFLGSLPSLIKNFTHMHDWITSNLSSTPTATYQTSILPFPFLARRQGLVTVTSNPLNLEHILKSNFHNYPKGPHWHSVFHDLLGDGIFNSDGDTWRVQRKTAALEFTTRTLRLAMGRWVGRAVRFRLGPVLKQAQEMELPVDIQDLMLRLTFDNICGLAFGRDPQTLAPSLPENIFASSFDMATEASLQRFVFPGIVWKVRKWLKLGMENGLCSSLKEIDTYLSEVIQARKKELNNNSSTTNNPHDDLLSRFMKKKKTETETETSTTSSYSDKFLQQVALNFILAGRDTSSVAMTWFFWLMTQHPQIELKIIHELANVLLITRGDDIKTWVDEPLTYEEAEQLVYLKAALSETLRLYPSVPEDSKYVIEDDVLPDGTLVPAGSSVTYSIYAAGRMRSTWGDDCNEFRPERWIDERNGRFRGFDQFRFVAFNAGPRVCLGKELAYLQMKTVAAGVLLKHRLVVVDGFKVEQKMSLTLFMKYGLKVNVYARDLSGIVEELKKK